MRVCVKIIWEFESYPFEIFIVRTTRAASGDCVFCNLCVLSPFFISMHELRMW